MKSINELTNEHSEALAAILKYDIPYAEGVKEELIECYSPDIEGLTLGKYMPIKLFFTGLHWLSEQGYDLSELIKNIGIESNIDFYPKEIQRLKTKLDNANAIVSKLSKTPPTAHTEELSREGGVWKLISEGLPSDDNALCLFISWKDEWKTSYASYFGTLEQAKNHRDYDLKNHYTHYMIIEPPKNKNYDT